MKLVAILRIKDQILTIDECMTKLSTLADEIIVLDNGSTDGTLDAYKKYQKITRVLHAEGFDEGRDKILLLEEAKKTKADWILWIDADEIFEKHFTREVVEGYMHSNYNRINFRMCNFWLSKTRCIYDGEYYLYALHPQRSMWKNMPSAYFKNQKIHNGNIMGVSGSEFLSPYRLKHLGYADKAKIEEKIQTYLSVDPNSTRDYKNGINPNVPRKTFRFFEFENFFVNFLYIELYKYVCNMLWIVERMRQKIKKVI